MLSFNKFITEARMTTREEIVNAIAQYKKAGEIVNPAYQDLSSQAKRVLKGDTKHVIDLMLKHFHAGDKTPDLDDLYYSFPRDNFVSMAKAERILAKIKDPKYKDVVSAATEVLKNWKPVAADLKDLKGKVVKVTQKRAEAKTAAAAAFLPPPRRREEEEKKPAGAGAAATAAVAPAPAPPLDESEFVVRQRSRNSAPAVAAGGLPLSRHERRSEVAVKEAEEEEEEEDSAFSPLPSPLSPDPTSAEKAGTEWTCFERQRRRRNRERKKREREGEGKR